MPFCLSISSPLTASISAFWKHSTLAFLITATSLVSPCFAGETEPDTGLIEEQIDALERASLGDFQVKAMTGEIDNIPRTVILLGESRLRNGYAHDAGRKLLSLFPFRGLGHVSKKSFLTRLGLLPVTSFIFTIETLTGIAESKAPLTLETAINDADVITPEGSTVLQKRESEEGASSDLATNIELEAGASGTSAFAQSWMLSGAMLSPSLTPMVFAGIDKILNSTYTPLSLAGTLAGGYLMTQLIGLLPMVADEITGIGAEKLTHPLVFPLFYYLREYKNQLMVENIHKSLQYRSYENVMLVIVHRGYIPGMTTLLSNKYNFKEISLPIEEAETAP